MGIVPDKNESISFSEIYQSPSAFSIAIENLDEDKNCNLFLIFPTLFLKVPPISITLYLFSSLIKLILK